MASVKSVTRREMSAVTLKMLMVTWTWGREARHIVTMGPFRIRMLTVSATASSRDQCVQRLLVIVRAEDHVDEDNGELRGSVRVWMTISVEHATSPPFHATHPSHVGRHLWRHSARLEGWGTMSKQSRHIGRKRLDVGPQIKRLEPQARA